MFKKVVSLIAVTTACALCLSGCTSGKLNTDQTCELLYKLAAENSLEEKWQMATIAIQAQNSQPAAEAFKGISQTYQEVSEQTSNQQLRRAFEALAENYQHLADAVDQRSFDDPTLMSDVAAATAEMDVEQMDYVEITCPGPSQEMETKLN